LDRAPEEVRHEREALLSGAQTETLSPSSAGSQPPKEAAVKSPPEGAAVYSAKCESCHGSDGKGAKGVYPSLVNWAGIFAGVEGGRAYLARVCAYGLAGPITAHGANFNGTMPPSGLGDGETAAVINYVIDRFNSSIKPPGFKPFTAEEIRSYKESSFGAGDVHSERVALIHWLKLASSQITAYAQSAESQRPALPPKLPAGTSHKPSPSAEASESKSLAMGANVFATTCIVCHQPGARGVEGIYPPLADSIGLYMRVKEGRRYLVHVPSFGLTGPIEVHGKKFDNTMPPLSMLNDEQIAAVLNFILKKFNASVLPSNFKPLTADEVKKYRAHEMSEIQVNRERANMISTLARLGAISASGAN
jgi:mono/diheme cytochrome c family protein